MATKYSFKIRAILPLVFALFIDNLSFGSVYPLVTGIFQNHPELFFDASVDRQTIDAMMGIAYLLFPLGMFFGASLLGDISDHIGRKRTLVICMIGVGFGFLIMTIGTLIGALILFLIGRLITGLMAGAQPIAQASIVDMSDKKNKALNMSFITFAVIMGVAIGPVVGGFFADQYLFHEFGYYLPLLVIGLLAFLAALWIGVSFKEPEGFHRVKRRINWARPITVFVEAMTHKWIRTLSITFFVFQVGFSIYFQFMLVKLQKEFAFTVFYMGLFTGFLGLSFMIALTLIMKRVVHLCRVEYLTVITLIGNGVAIFISGYMHSILSIWIFAFFVGVFDILAYTTILTAFSNATNQSSQGWALGIATSSMALAWLVSALFANLIPVLGIDNLIALGGILVILSLFIMYGYCRAKNLTWRENSEKEV
ncbi:MAG: MFS transporter [Rhabdochlamydiaceae bacterium]|nr:MFS transporter [Candidatus Amphrikana amoebophyrae]